MSKFNLRT